MQKKLSIVIPVYNEGRTILKILEKIDRVLLPDHIVKEIIVVNDCSVDDSEKIIQEYSSAHPAQKIQYYRHSKNRGKGAALHTGIAAATGDFLIIQDADLEYDPEEYPVLLKPVLEGFADVVYGSRFVSGRPHRTIFFWHTVGNKFLTSLSNMLTNLNLTDMETCYKLFRTEILRKIVLKEKRFGFEPEVTAKIAKIPGIRIYEVGISYHGRTYEEGKKIKWKDGFRALYCIVKYKIVK